jgi:hypothetical protein
MEIDYAEAFKPFIDQCLVIQRGSSLRAKDAFEVFKRWSDRAWAEHEAGMVKLTMQAVRGINSASPATLGKGVVANGIPRSVVNGRAVYRGVAIRPEWLP